MKFILRLLIDFRFARRRLGGKWYFVSNGEEVHGFGGPIYYWTRKVNTECEKIIKEESY